MSPSPTRCRWFAFERFVKAPRRHRSKQFVKHRGPRGDLSLCTVRSGASVFSSRFRSIENKNLQCTPLSAPRKRSTVYLRLYVRMIQLAKLRVGLFSMAYNGNLASRTVDH
eukprot:6182980-Pleurochrysis_carterae.AAC.1